MDLDEVKVCLRSLLSSTAVSCNLNRLLCDFRNTTGLDMPLFGHLHPIEFLRTLTDTVQLFGSPYNPEVALVQSVKSAHITSLVDRQKANSGRNRCPQFLSRPKRLIIHDRNLSTNYLLSDLDPRLSKKPTDPKTSHTTNTSQRVSDERVPNTSPFRTDDFGCRTAKDKKSPSSPAKTNSNRPRSGESRMPYFEDISDNESCLSIEDGRSSCAASGSCFVNEGIKNKLKRLIKYYPKGLWCCDLPESFQKEYNFALDYREYGYTSLIQMLSELPDVFRCLRPGNEDWLLFDASVAPSPEEKKMMDLQAATDINYEVTANVRKLLFSYFENASNSRIELDSVMELYKKMFGCCLDFQSLGFKDLRSFLRMWEGSLFSFLEFEEKTFLVPVLKMTVQSTIHWQEALPPITAENDIFVEIFPKDVVGPEESLLELDLARHLAVGSVVKVSVAEVWSPSLFYLQLNKFRDRLDLFMDNLQRFYNIHLNKYKMPDSTVRPKQICVGLYTADPDFPDEWHRAQIVKVINEKIVLVNFVDFGTETRVKKTHLRFLHRSFQSFPVQGLLAQLSGVAPADGENKWPITTSKRFLELVRVPFLDAEIVDIDFKKPRMSVILFDPSQKSGLSINKKLIQLKLACWREPDFCFVVRKEPATDRKEPETKPEVKKGPATGGAWVQGITLPEIAYEFSDIADLAQPPLFKMMSVKNQDPARTRREQNSVDSLKYEFEDVPDLDVKSPEEQKKETVPNVSTERKQPESASISPVVAPTPRPDSPVAAAVALPQEKPLPPVSIPPPEKTASSPADVPCIEKLTVSSPQPELSQTVPEVQSSSFSPFPRKPRRLPPGLEHANPMTGFGEMEFLPPQDDLRKKINILAMEFLTTNSSIKQVGVSDPVLAVKIATEMAEACITSKYCKDVALPVCPEAASSPDVTPTAVEPKDTSKDCISPPEQSQPSPPKERDFIRREEIAGKTLHIITVDEQPHFCADEIVRNFTVISSREVADRILQIKKIQIDYRIVTKATDEKLLNAIKSSQLQIVKKKSKKLKLFLIPLPKVLPYLQGLGSSTKAFENDVQKLQL